ncbi:hypothetical protein AKJ09_04897 [Labilithrix luteola]|uniref:Type IV fimbrial biogenesis protein PilY1 n=1 Tax=Labilithrix luteola TaxID=1391654 RepID=A0A0K1PXJ1_9BACT|nr:hypothetical protein [Labilithrix luteola]AKU98233.1 hypothetical protein AKJ09_04897 [Labilithrix luteola]
MNRFVMGTGLGLGLAFVLTFVGCADSNETPPASSPPEQEAGVLPGVDASAVDSGADANADARTDAEAGSPRECSDDGFCHTTVPPKQTIRSIWGDRQGVAWAVTDEGAILRWDGAAWSVHQTFSEALLTVWGSGPTDIWVGSGTSLYHGEGTTSAGLTFAQVDLPGDTTQIKSIWGTGPNDIWAIGPVNDFTWQGRVLHYTGPGTGKGGGWTLDPVSTQRVFWNKVVGTPNSGVWLAGVRSALSGNEFVVLRKEVGADAFTQVTVPGDPKVPNPAGNFWRFWGASASSDDTIWFFGKTGSGTLGFIRGTSADSGATFTWTFFNDGRAPAPQMQAIWGTTANDAWFVGDYGRVRHWDGTSFTQSAITITKVPVIDPFYAVWANGADDVWVAGKGVAFHKDPSKKP